MQIKGLSSKQFLINNIFRASGERNDLEYFHMEQSMSAHRGLSPEAYHSLKAATRRQIEAAGGLEAAASLTRVSKTELSNYQHPLKTRRFIPVDVAADLAHSSGANFILDAMAQIANCVVEPVHMDGESLERNMINFGEYASITFRDYAAAHAGPSPEYEDLERLDHDLDEVVRVAMHARATIKKRMAHATRSPKERP